MGYLGDGFRALALTLKSAFRPPVTVHYPAEKRQRAERFRTSFALLHDADGDEACVGCLQCDKICPSQVITVIAEKKESPVRTRFPASKSRPNTPPASFFIESDVPISMPSCMYIIEPASATTVSPGSRVMTTA